jgi:hypothetical protein
MTNRFRWSLSGAVLLAGALLALPAAGQEECQACHEDVAKAFAKTDHGRSFRADEKYKDTSCISCHTGVKEHVESSGEKKPSSLRRGGDANVACLACHADIAETHGGSVRLDSQAGRGCTFTLLLPPRPAGASG